MCSLADTMSLLHRDEHKKLCVNLIRDLYSCLTGKKAESTQLLPDTNRHKTNSISPCIAGAVHTSTSYSSI